MTNKKQLLINRHEWFDSYAEWNGWDYSVAELIEVSRDLKVFEAPVEAFRMSQTFSEMNMMRVAETVLRVQSADITYPILLAPDGTILDGNHRLLKHLVEGIPTIKFKRLKTMPKAWREATDD